MNCRLWKVMKAQRFRRRSSVVALSLCLVDLAAAGTPRAAQAQAATLAGPDKGALTRAGSWMVDDLGRVVAMHGFDIVWKAAPFYPPNFTATDAQFLANEGVTAARIGFIWEGVEPQPGVYDDAYIQHIVDLNNLLGSYGIRTLVDFHQDSYSATAGTGIAGVLVGDGAPAWATLAPGSADGSFQHFWNDDPAPDGVGIQTHFVNAWKHVAPFLASSTNLIGLDPLNEPYPGSGYPSPCGDFSPCPAFESGALAAFYNRVIAAIRSSDTRHMIFPEGIAMNAQVQPSLPAFADSLTAYNWHYYCLEAQIGNPDPGPATHELCASTDATAFSNIEAYTANLGVPWMVSEFGGADADYEYGTQIDHWDSKFLTWTEWMYYTDFPGPGNLPLEGLLVDDNQPGSEQNAKQAKLDSLVVPYPQATAGMPQSYSFDRTTNTMTYTYATTPATSSLCTTAPTQIWVPWRKYAAGYQVQATGATVVSPPGAPWVELMNSPGASTVTVTISQGVSIPPAPTQMPSQSTEPEPAGQASCEAALVAVVPETPFVPLAIASGLLAVSAAGVLRRRASTSGH